MGCSICLESYEDDSEKGRKPVALPCGHIFHRACSDGWLKSCRTRNDPACCPLCKAQLGSGRSLPLWPGDINDLDAYVSYRNRHMELQRTQRNHRPVSATIALDRHMSRERQAELLGSLMDFRQHSNAYVMAVNNVSMSTFGAEDRIYRLFSDLSKSGEEKQTLFEASLEALSTATNVMNETVGTMEGMRSEMTVKSQRIDDELAKIREMRKSLDRHMEMKAEEEQHMSKEHSRVKTLQLHLKKELQDVEKKREKLESERQACIKEANEKSIEAHKARFEAHSLVAQSKGHAEAEVQKMKDYVMEQEALRIQAEAAAREAGKKTAFMADRNKLLSDKLSTARDELKKAKSQGEGQSQSQPLSPSQVDTNGRLPLKIKGKALEARQWDHEGFLEVGHSARPDAGSTRFFRRPTSRNDSAIVIDDELEDDFDDSSYPMPAFLHNMRIPSSSTRPPIEDDDSVEIVGEKRKRERSNDDLIQSVIGSGHLAFGPRQRAR